MFAPPDPATTTADLPVPSGSTAVLPPVADSESVAGFAAASSLPALPPSGMPTLPSISAPVPPAPVPDAASDALTLDPSSLDAAPAFVQRPAAPVVLDENGDIEGSAPSREEERPDPPDPLIASEWLRRIVIGANLLSVPAAFAADLAFAGLVLVSFLALILWSNIAVTNVRRARTATRHAKPPHPLTASLSWFIAPAVALAGGIGLAAVANWVDSSSYDEEGTRAIAGVAALVVFGVVMLVALYRPYGVLARAAKWVSADAGKFRLWFIGPIIAAAVAIGVQVFSGLIVLTDGADGSSSSASIGAAVLLLVSFAFPWIAWLVFGNRAMRSLESGIAHAHGRSARAALDPAEVNTLLVAQNAAAGAAGGPVGVNAVNA